MRLCPRCPEVPCFRHCVWCSVDCDTAELHAADCPQVTGVYPAESEQCCTCGTLLDSYVLMPDADPSVAMVVCIGCAANELLL